MGSKRTICEVHRQLRRLLVKVGVKGKPLELLDEAFVMGKKMDNRLRFYQHDYSEGWWKANKTAGGSIDGQETRAEVGGLEQ